MTTDAKIITRSSKVREAVGVFDDINALNEAVIELEQTAFSRDTISILGHPAALEAQFGRPQIAPEMAEDNSEAPRRVPVRIEEQAIGTGVMIGGGAYLGAVGALLAAGAAVSVPTVIAAVAAAVAGGGAGGLLAKVLGDHFSRNVARQIEEGGVVLWVQTRTEESEKAACDILERHGARHVHIHEIE